jgi:cob(I)alamin adenosyltransferase
VISYDMLDPQKVVAALGEAGRVRVICTRRDAHPALMEAADFGREMQEVKYPYTKGIVGQRGIDC